MPSLHHIALACKDRQETNRFYQDILGFELVHAERENGDDGGWLVHSFYDIGDGSCIAFFELHGMGEPNKLRTDISTGLGLPAWVNHIAIRSDTDQVAAIRDRLQAADIPVEMDLDHGWCQSMYVRDPNDILIEFTVDTPGFQSDPDAAGRIVHAADEEEVV